MRPVGNGGSFCVGDYFILGEMEKGVPLRDNLKNIKP
jgi:hypothetical protein